MPVRTDRPRLWLTPASLADLKARATPANPRWSTLQALCDRSPADWDVAIPDYCLGYAISGNPSYAVKAWQLMLQSMAAGVAQVEHPGNVSTMGRPGLSPAHQDAGYEIQGKRLWAAPGGVHEVDGDSGYQCRNYFPAACMLYDLCYPALNDQQRQQLRADIEVCADWVWPETNPSRAHQWGVDADMAGNNYHHGFMFTWLAGLALAGDSPKAQGYLDNAKRRWQTEIVPYLQGPAQGGWFNEGSGYGAASAVMILQYLTAHFTATGEDLIASTPWCPDFVTAMIHLTTPDLKEMAPFGDLGAGPIADRHKTAMLLMAARDSRARLWLDALPNPRMDQRLSAWLDFAFYPGGLPTPTGDKQG